MSRKGSFLEKLISRLFNRVGFETKLNSNEFGFESDVIARKRNFKIIVETKQYDNAYINMGALIDQWANRAKRTDVDRVLLVVTGYKKIPEKYYQLAKQEGIYLWDEDTVHNLNDIGTKEQLYFEIGKRLEFTDVVEKLEKRAKKILTIKLISVTVIALLLFGYFFFLSDKEGTSKGNSNEITLAKEGVNVPEIQTPEEALLSFCEAKFKELSSYTMSKKSDYFEDYGSALKFIESRYPNEGLTINKARFFKEWYLDKAKFPIYIIEGEVEIQPSVRESGLYTCDETGMVKR